MGQANVHRTSSTQEGPKAEGKPAQDDTVSRSRCVRPVPVILSSQRSKSCHRASGISESQRFPSMPRKVVAPSRPVSKSKVHWIALCMCSHTTLRRLDQTGRSLAAAVTPALAESSSSAGTNFAITLWLCNLQTPHVLGY